MKDCRGCRDWNDCIGKEWYKPIDINFCKYQMVWLIEHYGEMALGNWPENPRDSGDIAVKAPLRNRAYFEVSCQMAGEMAFRLRRTGKEGEVLIDEITEAGITEIGMLSRMARSALYYICGEGRRETPYRVWKAMRKLSNVKKSST